MEIVKINPKKANIEAVKRAAEIIKNGGVVIFPSDTCYGLAADMTNPEAIKKVYFIKQRESEKQLSVIVKNLNMIKKYCHVSRKTEQILKNNLPGPFTFVLPLKNPKRSQEKTLGIRWLNTPTANALSGLIKVPYTATSANISSKPAIYNSKEIIQIWGKADIQPDLFLNGGDLPQKPPSTVIDLTKKTPKILRAGPIAPNLI